FDFCSFTLVGKDGLTVCVSGLWARVDSIREQKNIEARKLLENRAESHKSAARFVGTLFVLSRFFFSIKL
ncbi:MAG: hypothetical protein AABZ00_15515, partial [Chloroflexota bacterium]